MFHNPYRLAPTVDSLHFSGVCEFLSRRCFSLYLIVSIVYYFSRFVKKLLSPFFGFFGKKRPAYRYNVYTQPNVSGSFPH